MHGASYILFICCGYCMKAKSNKNISTLLHSEISSVFHLVILHPVIYRIKYLFREIVEECISG